jgi:hypothetical protein
MLAPIPFTNSYRQALDILSNSAFSPVTVNQFVEKIQGATIVWSYDIPHSTAGPQNIASTSTVQLDARPKMQVLKNDKIEYWVIQDDAGTADYLYQFTVRIDPNNTTDLRCNSSALPLELKNRKAKNEETGEVIDDASILLFDMCKLYLVLYHNVFSPNNSLGAGVSNANIGSLFVDYSAIVYVLPQYSSF